mmetsp:Transcript_119614/g.168256  ORF Transcript_119614/g.168256 Transcript_119614/m.168256 type:complete len:216 (-) Transcript_119614:297-944(-)
MAPAEGNFWRSREDFQQFPREGSEGIVELLIGLLPSDLLRIVELRWAPRQQHVVVANGIGLLVVVLLPSVGTHMKFLRIHGTMLTWIRLVGAFHFPGLHQILHNGLQRSGRVIFGLAFQIFEVCQGIARNATKPPLDALLFQQSKLCLQFLQLLPARRQLISAQRLARTCWGQGATHVRLCHGRWSIYLHFLGRRQHIRHRCNHFRVRRCDGGRN